MKTHSDIPQFNDLNEDKGLSIPFVSPYDEHLDLRVISERMKLSFYRMFAS